MAALKRGRPEARDEVSQALVKIGSPSVPPLIEVLGEANLDLRRPAAFRLGELGDRRAVEALIPRL